MPVYACVLVNKDTGFDGQTCVAFDETKQGLAVKAGQFISELLRSDVSEDDEVCDMPCMHPDFSSQVASLSLRLLDFVEGPWSMIDVLSHVLPWHGDDRVFLTRVSNAGDLKDGIASYAYKWGPPRRALTSDEVARMKAAAFKDVDVLTKIGSLTRDWTLLYCQKANTLSNPSAARSEGELAEKIQAIEAAGFKAAVYPPGHSPGLEK